MRPLRFRACALTLVAVLVSGAASLTAAVQQREHHQLSDNSRHLTASSQPTFGISSLHASTLANGTGATSLTGNLTGIKPGLPATCYGQPCSASVCYPAATVSVAQYVNYVNVTATVEFERQYNVSSKFIWFMLHIVMIRTPVCNSISPALHSTSCLASFCTLV